MHQPDQLIAERHEHHERQVLIRRRDEPVPDPRLVGAAPLAPEQLLVLATPGAHRVPSLVAALPELLRSIPELTEEIESVWLGVVRLAADAEVALRLAKELDVEIVVPDGGVAAMPGAALYAGYSAGGTGWHRFRPDRPAEFRGARFPLPVWESWMPTTPVEVDGFVAVPAPCGLLVCDGTAEFADTAYDVPVNQRFPKIVVGGTGSVPPPAVVAALLASLPDQPVMVVPATPEPASHIWQAEVALRLSREVVFSAGMQVRTRTGAVSTIVPDAAGNRAFRPFPLVLRQTVGGGDQQVLEIAAAPPGWVRDGRRSYRRVSDGGDRPGDVVADVVPSGLVLRSAGGELADPAAEAAPFDPAGWTLAVGTSGQVVGLPVLAAAEELLTVLPAEQRATVRVRMAGVMDDVAERALDRWAVVRERRPEPPVPPVGPPPAAPADPSSVRLRLEPVLPARGTPLLPQRHTALSAAVPPVPAPPPRDTAPAAMPPIVTTSAAPVSTVSGPQTPPPARQPERVEPEHTEPERTVAVEPQARAAAPAEAERPPVAHVGGQVEATPPPAETAPPAATVRPLAVPVRASTAAEQTRFTAATGESFAEALATVNAALATWPSMRVDESPGAKADYVAVCLFLGRGDGGAQSINGALRTGQTGALDSQVPCLMSGIRRLPTHRRAVLRQGKVDESLEHRSAPGTVLTEPGFLAASIDLDVTVPGADLDVLIWPSSARRTSELMLGRPIDEAVFVAGARFKALAVRIAAEDEESEEEDDEAALAAPRVAVLYRELAPGETPSTTELDERDLAVLAKLDSVLARRKRGPLRLVEDPELIARLTTSMVAWQQEAAGAGRTAVAS